MILEPEKRKTEVGAAHLFTKTLNTVYTDVSEDCFTMLS